MCLLYDEGRMIGPLQRSEFAMYRFQGLPVQDFKFLDNENHMELHIKILETAPRADFPEDQEWLLIFPQYITPYNIVEHVSFPAIIIAIQREKRSRILATWEYLVQVSCIEPRLEEPVIVEGHLTEYRRLDVYIECGQ